MLAALAGRIYHDAPQQNAVPLGGRTNISVERSAAISIMIRAGEATDATALAELAARTFRETFSADNRPEDVAVHTANAYGTSQQERELLDPDIATLLAEVDGQLAGYAQLRSGVPPACVTGEEPIELWRFYIARPWHGQGVAQALMREVERDAHRRGGRTLWLGVWERNERAKAFYHKNGFRDVGSHVFMVGTDAQTDRILVRALATGKGASEMSEVSVRYMIDDVPVAVKFYTTVLGFTLEHDASPAFAAVARDGVRLLLSGEGSSGKRSLADGRRQVPGGWNRIHLEVGDLEAEVARLRSVGVPFRTNDIVTGPGGAQVIIEDPSGNPIELFQSRR